MLIGAQEPLFIQCLVGQGPPKLMIAISVGDVALTYFRINECLPNQRINPPQSGLAVAIFA